MPLENDCPDKKEEIDPIERARKQHINFPNVCDGSHEGENEPLDGKIVHDESEYER